MQRRLLLLCVPQIRFWMCLAQRNNLSKQHQLPLCQRHRKHRKLQQSLKAQQSSTFGACCQQAAAVRACCLRCSGSRAGTVHT